MRSFVVRNFIVLVSEWLSFHKNMLFQFNVAGAVMKFCRMFHSCTDNSCFSESGQML